MEPEKLIQTFNWKWIALALLVALVGMVFIQINNEVEKKTEDAYKIGIEEGTQKEKDRIFGEIADDLNTLGAYRMPVEVQDGTNTIESFMILIPPSRCPR